MATITRAILIDDIDDAEASETLQFNADGTNYEKPEHCQRGSSPRSAGQVRSRSDADKAYEDVTRKAISEVACNI